MKKVRVGIVGSRFAANLHAHAYGETGEADLVAVAAVDNLEEFAAHWCIPNQYGDYREMLARDDLDLISVCAPNFLHRDVVVAAAEAGKHVVCEKPLAVSAGQARDMVRTCNTRGVKLMYAEDWCFAPALTRAAGLVREGAIGDVLYVKAKEAHSGTHSPYAKDKKTCGGGSLIHLAVHPIGWLLDLCGDNGKNRVVEVIGRTNGGGRDNYVHTGNTGEDWAVGIMKFENGIHGLIEGNYITAGGMDDRVEIYGAEGVIRADLTFGSPLAVYSRRGFGYAVEKADTTTGWTRPAVDEFYSLGYLHELKYFVGCVLKNEQPAWGVSGECGLRCMEVVEAMYQSTEQDRTIRIE